MKTLEINLTATEKVTLTYSESAKQWDLFSGNCDLLAKMAEEAGWDFQQSKQRLADWAAENKDLFLKQEKEVTTDELWNKDQEQKQERFNQLTKGREIIKSEYQAMYEIIASGNVKEVHGQFARIYQDYAIAGSHSGKLVHNNIGESFMEMVKLNANDFTRDIASKCLDKEFDPSPKQAWCMAYQIVNNKQVYLNTIMQQWDHTSFTMEPDEIMSAETVELSRLAYEIFAASIK